MKTIPSMIFLAALLTVGATGCEGATGPAGPEGATGPAGADGGTGPAGGGYYTSRTGVYCNRNAYPAGATAAAIKASCNTTTDLPLQGACDLSNGVYSTSLTLAVNLPEWWTGASLTVPADWACAWTDSTGALVAPQGAAAMICCITVP